MLVIRRKAGESVWIGDSIEVEVIDVTPTRVKLGFKAPDGVVILRREIREAGEQNRLAVRRVAPALVEALVSRLR